MSESLRGKTAVAGIGCTPWYKRGTAPETEARLAARAVVAAADDAGLDPRDIDGFVSWGSERNSGTNLMMALGTKELKFGALMWMHGGGSSGSIGLAAQAIATGQADTVVVIRAMAENSLSTRLSIMVGEGSQPPNLWTSGMVIPAQNFALHASRITGGGGLPRECARSVVLASYHHANNNPAASGHNINLDEEAYADARSPIEPLHLYDNSRENDGAIALILTSSERARDLRQKPAYVLASPMGRYGGLDTTRWHTPEGRPTSGFRSVADRCWQQSGYGPADVDVVQAYSNGSASAAVALIDHGFCSWKEAGEFLTYDNLIAPGGVLPLNTAGGDLGDGFLHGAGNNIEAVRQIRGISSNQVPDAKLSLSTGGPTDFFVSTTLLGSEETL